MKSKKVNLWLDVILAVGLAMAMLPGVTGAPMHQRIGIALGVGVVVHLLLHWKWIVATSKPFMKLPGAVRFKLALNILSLLAFALTIVSGLMNPGTLSGNASAGSHGHALHHASALLAFLTVALHLARHRAPIGRAARRFMPQSPSVGEIGSVEDQ